MKLLTLKKIGLFVSLSSLALAAGCGDDSLSGDVKITSTPDTPLVRLADFESELIIENPAPTPPVLETATAPWTVFDINVENESEEQLTITSVTVKVVGLKNGQLQSFNVTIIDLLRDDEPIISRIDPFTTENIVNDSPATGIYISSLPSYSSTSTEETDLDSPYIRVEVQLNGYFGDSDQDIKQFFDKEYIFSAEYPN